jgi:limonene-1,2-epoxide hydrolase
MWMDAEILGRERSKLEEIAVYQVENGKIIKEMFFF